MLNWFRDDRLNPVWLFMSVSQLSYSNWLIIYVDKLITWYRCVDNINLKMLGSGQQECVSNEFNFIFIVLSEQKIVSSILWKRHFLKETLSDIAQINSIQISFRYVYYAFIEFVFSFNLVLNIPDICYFSYTGNICWAKILHPKVYKLRQIGFHDNIASWHLVILLGQTLLGHKGV